MQYRPLSRRYLNVNNVIVIVSHMRSHDKTGYRQHFIVAVQRHRRTRRTSAAAAAAAAAIVM